MDVTLTVKPEIVLGSDDPANPIPVRLAAIFAGHMTLRLK